MRRLLLAALVALPLGQIRAQGQAARTTATWLTIGSGLASWGGLTELGAGITASHQSHGRLLSARLVGGGDILAAWFGAVFGSTGAVVGVQDLGLLAGVGAKPGLIHVSGGAGIGIATITRIGSGSSDTKTSRLGVPLEVQVFIQPLRFLGVGVYGYGDLNKEKSFWGWNISVAVGRLR